MIKQVAFSGGVAPIPTTRVRFYTPEQPLADPIYGTGNWAYNTVEQLEYDYDLGDYEATGIYSGGIDPTVGQFTVEVLEADLDPYAILYNDSDPQNYLSKQALVDSFNADPNNLDFQIVLPLVGNLNKFLSPPDSFAFFNDYIFRYSYDYVSPQYADYEDIDTTFGAIGINDVGVDPTLTSYEGTFGEGNIGTFVNDHPCEDKVNEVVCLTNDQAQIIINELKSL